MSENYSDFEIYDIFVEKNILFPDDKYDSVQSPSSGKDEFDFDKEFDKIEKESDCENPTSFPYFVDGIIKNIYDNSTIQYFINLDDNKKYGFNKTKWYSEDNHFGDDEPYECDGYCGCESEYINNTVISESHIIYKFQESGYKSTINFIKKYSVNTHEVNRDVVQLIDNKIIIYRPDCKKSISKSITYDPKKIIISNCKDIIIYNKSGINKDHRGSDHCRLKLKFHSKYKLKKPVSLHDFVDGLFRVKSHKYDTWYELFFGCEMIEASDKIKIVLEFDHGS